MNKGLSYATVDHSFHRGGKIYQLMKRVEHQLSIHNSIKLFVYRKVFWRQVLKDYFPNAIVVDESPNVLRISL